MSDEELLRRVAEVEGYVNGAEVEWDWNPLADTERGRSQAFELVWKYEMDLICENHRGVWTASTGEGDCGGVGTDESLHRAICLAVVATKESS